MNYENYCIVKREKYNTTLDAVTDSEIKEKFPALTKLCECVKKHLNLDYFNEGVEEYNNLLRDISKYNSLKKFKTVESTRFVLQNDKRLSDIPHEFALDIVNMLGRDVVFIFDGIDYPKEKIKRVYEYSKVYGISVIEQYRKHVISSLYTTYCELFYARLVASAIGYTGLFADQKQQLFLKDIFEENVKFNKKFVESILKDVNRNRKAYGF